MSREEADRMFREMFGAMGGAFGARPGRPSAPGAGGFGPFTAQDFAAFEQVLGQAIREAARGMGGAGARGMPGAGMGMGGGAGREARARLLGRIPIPCLAPSCFACCTFFVPRPARPRSVGRRRLCRR